MREVYFPNSGVSSVTTLLGDGRMVETAVVGVEGMVGIEAWFSEAPMSQGHVMMQVPGTDAEMLSIGVFREAVAKFSGLTELMGRYAMAVLRQSMQSTACNALHAVQERCARWLLLTHDRVEGDTFELSHEFLATMLAVTRPSVSVAAGTLQNAGMISYRHGVMRVLDRKALEQASCECYTRIREQFRLLDLPHGCRRVANMEASTGS